jgi:DNA ligase D-like protein (predicted ligase)
MLATSGEPFDSQDFTFEVKWDGTRVLAFIEGDGHRLLNRRKADAAERYPELEFLRALEPGTVLDGEIVVLRDGKPDFRLLLSREHAGGALRRRTAAREHPATYVVFDQLYAGFEPCMDEPIEKRRERLRGLVQRAAQPRLAFSEEVRGTGRAFFDAACRQGLEGIMAKRLGSIYTPGKRSDAWIKIKAQRSILCAVIGYVPAGKDDFRSLIIAAQDEGELRCVGKVGTGFDAKLREELNRRLRERPRPRPLIACPVKGKWVEPGLYCTVTYLERSPSGQLRAPVFRSLVEGR